MFLECLCLTASAGHGRAERLSEFLETLHEFEAHLSVFLERLCLTASAGYGRAERLSEFRELLYEFEAHLSEFLECLCLTASAGYGRAERLSEFRDALHEFGEHLSEFREILCLTAPAGYGRAERLSEFRDALHEFEEHLSEFLECLRLTAPAGHVSMNSSGRSPFSSRRFPSSSRHATMKETASPKSLRPARVTARTRNWYTPPKTSPSSTFFTCLVGEISIHGSPGRIDRDRRATRRMR